MTGSIHADSDRTVRISERRFESSPYFDCYRNDQMVMGVYAGRFYAKTLGEDREEVYWALRRTAALYDVPERPVQIEGPDAVAFMERIFARRIGNLKEGRGRYALALTAVGRLFMDGVLFNLSNGVYWYVQPDGALETWLEAHSEGYDVTVSDPHSRVVQIQGPASLEIMRDASGGAIDETLGYFHAGYFDLGGQQLYVSRTGWTGELGYEIYSQGDQTDYPRLWDHLMQAGEPHGMRFGGTASMEIRRIEAGILDSGTDFDSSMTPYEAGLGAFVGLDNENFIGRQVLIGADQQSCLFGVTCGSTTPNSEQIVLQDGVVVGQVTAGAWSPYLECGVAYVRFDKAGDWAGTNLSLKDPDGTRHDGKVVALPFYDPEKKIARGLDRTIPDHK